MKKTLCVWHHHLLPSLKIVLLTSLSFSASQGFAVTSTPFWKSPTFIGGADRLLQQGDRFFAYDNLGVPNIATTNGTDVSLHRQVPGLGWRSRSVAFSPGNANGVSIAINRREQPAISYGDSAGLHYVSWDAFNNFFIDSLVDDSSISSRNYSGGTSMAFDLTGRPAIAAVSTAGGTWYVTDNNGDGTLTNSDTVEQAISFSDYRPTLTFDGLNHPIIAGIDGSFLDVAIKDPFIGWSPTTVANALGTPIEPTSVANGSVAIDPDDGLPAVAWTNQATGNLHYAKWNLFSNSWVTEIAAAPTAGLRLSNESLAFDPGDGHPAISYSDNLGQLFFAYHNGVAWNTQLILDNSPDVPLRTSLDFNEYGHGFPAIAYIDGSGSVLFTVDPPLAAIPEPTALALACLPVILGLGRLRWHGTSSAFN